VTLNLNFPKVSVEEVYNTITTATPKQPPPAHSQSKHRDTLTLPKINVYRPPESDGHSSVKRTERGVLATTNSTRGCSQHNETQDAQAPVTTHQTKEMAKSLSKAVDRQMGRSRSAMGWLDRSYSLKTLVSRRAPRERQVDPPTTSRDAMIHGSSIMTLLNARPLEADIVAVELDQISVKLCDLGNYHGACDMSRRAVQVLQDACFATKNEPSDTYATALYNLAIHLSHVGRYEEAFLSAREAVATYTHLRTFESNRGPVLEANLALSQLTLANCLSYNGNTKEALISARQSVDIYQSFSGSGAVEFRADLAMSLVNYADKLRAAGQVAAAQNQAQLAIDIYMRLHKTHASKYGAEYAAALNVNAKCLHDLENHDEALRLVKACIAIWRALEHSRPGIFTHHLADSLMEAQAIYSSLGVGEEASRAAKEGVSLFRKLASGYPDRFNQHLVSSLTCAARVSVRAKDFLQAIKFFNDAIDTCEGSTVNIVSDVQRADILEDVAQCYRKVTNFAAAQKYSKTAVEKRRWLLSKGESHANVLALARSLRELAISRSEGLSFKPDNLSLQLLTEGISLYRSLSQENYYSDLIKLSIATSLQELAALQTQLKLHREAVESACEAVECFAHLTQTRPDLRSAFAQALLDHSVIHSNLGFLSDALETATQAVSVAEVVEGNDRQELLAKSRKQVVVCCRYGD
jgi:tetratricopeptide (TPR) repeat protein